MKKGILAVVSGFSGAGKGTIMKSLISRYNNYELSVSATTRNPRPGETEGKDYFFVSDERFQEMIRNNELVEYAKYVDHYYGTPRRFVEEQMEKGRDVLLEIEIQGAMKIRKQFPDAVLIFIAPPSGAELKRRLLGRGTETEDVVNQRLCRAIRESEGVEQYDYILINDEVGACTERLHSILCACHERTSAHMDVIENIREELRRIEDGKV